MTFPDCAPDVVSAAENAYAIHAHAMLAKGLAPVRIIPRDKAPGWITASGKPHYEAGWQHPVSSDGVNEFLNANDGRRAGLGALCGPTGVTGPSSLVEPGEHIVFADFDAIAPEYAAKVRALLPACDCVTFGRGPKIAFRSSSIIGNPKWLLPIVPGEEKSRCAFEIKASGQVVLAGVHPATGQPYSNPEGLGLQDRTDLLPLIADDVLARIDEALTGYATRTATAAKTHKPEDGGGAHEPTGDDWRDVNNAALANREAWVPALGLPGTRQKGEFWVAVASYRASTGKRADHQRDTALSFGSRGIIDNATGQRFTAIDIVALVGGCTPGEAKDWLESKLGIERERIPDEQVQALLDNAAAKKAAKVSEDRGGAQQAAPTTPEQDATGQETSPAPSASTTLPEASEAELFAGLADNVPGLLGDIASWIVETAAKPQPVLALGAALVIIGTAAGRRYYGPSGSGTHAYVVGLAGTGAGKDHPRSAILDVLIAGGAGAHLGTATLKSAAALSQLVKRSPLAVCALDEFGELLGRAKNSKSSPHLAELSAELRKLWGLSGKVYQTPEWAGAPSVTLHSPSISVFATSTPREFYAGLTSADATNGFLNRFLLLRGDDSAPLCVAKPEPVPFEIASRVNQIYCGGITGNLTEVEGFDMGQFRNDHAEPNYKIAVEFGKGAESIYRKAEAGAYAIAQRDQVRGDFYGRAAEMALRCATIRAIGNDPTSPVISVADMGWAIRLVSASAGMMFEVCRKYVADGANQAAYKEIKRAIASKGADGIGHSALLKFLDGKMNARTIKEIVGQLVEAGDMVMVEGAKAGNGTTPKTYFAVT